MKRKNLRTKIFIASSILAFFVFVLLLILIKVYIGYNSNVYVERYKENDPKDYKYYLNRDYGQRDPFITRIPSLEDMLLGPIISTLDPSFGNSEAQVTIVVFSDYECNFCYEQEKQLKEVVGEYRDKIKLIRKDYPRNDINSTSYQAAIAARCAAKQDNFWQYHDAIYENSDNLTRETYNEIAVSLGLELDDFKECFAAREEKQLIDDNILEANALDINGVPFLYINDQEIMGQISREDLKRIIEIELREIKEREM